MKYFLISLILSVSVWAQSGIDNSLKFEVQASMKKGENFLLSQQNENGSWGLYGGVPAYTALSLTTLAMSPSRDQYSAQMDKAAKYLNQFINPDGSIHDRSEHAYPNYTTSVTLMALFIVDRQKYADVIRKGRRFLVKSQFGPESGVEAGGIGYGSNKTKSDLSNTQYALEALYVTESVDQDGVSPEDVKATREAWAKALEFVERCQSSKENDEKLDIEWKERNYGGFRYSPDRSKADEADKAPYGGMTYAGIKSMIYAKLDKDDPRIKAALEWVKRNYTLDENPGLKLQGHFYYIHTFAKALHAAQIEEVDGENGVKHHWRRDVCRKLLSMQAEEGSWVNTENRWQENNRQLVTAYALMSMYYAMAHQ
ncbi:prenyltransferase/squalene oxidase repeat-containing protein [Lentisphaera profundi]|uniref:Prenyltransferase/squalene oxidase repeat-containing protein n=1 Tax=Lentisphaera profundi TaxID=1658616 RepID=A0ABY7VSY4_9BACT|nr:prenyltransferase/squalene oxidase repeat-containing protein [Lentisphaera profundi]WDE96859.1 prenyltransferase/squalene oxidase repeat-containing protein [Lentisphaera profundi]